DLNLIAPSKVRVALSGAPASARSQQRLEALRAAGVETIAATRTELLYALEDLGMLARGPRGFAVATVSTHGIEDGGSAYLMAEERSRRFTTATGIGIGAVHDALAKLPECRRLLIVDACRASLESSTRGDALMTDQFHQALSTSAQGVALLASCNVGQV